MSTSGRKTRTCAGAVISIQVPDGTGGGLGQFINNKGVLVGVYLDGNGAYHCFTRTREGVITELPDAPNAGSGDQQGTECIGINKQGDISGGAIDSNEGAPGPIYLQGDHGPVDYRNVVLTPAR